MTDQRGLTFGVSWAMNTAPLDDTKQKEAEVQQESKRTAESVEQIGISLQGVGTRASTAFSGVKGAGTSMGSVVSKALNDSIKRGDSLGKTLRTGIGAAFDNARAKAQGFGAGAKSVMSDFSNAIKHPIETLKLTLGTALANAKDKVKDLGSQADDTGDDMKQMGQTGGSAADNLGSKFSSLIKTIAGLAIIKKATDAIKNFISSSVDAAASAEEMQSKFETVFGDATAGAETWASNFATAAKRSKDEVKGFLADSQAMAKGLGMSEDAGAAMSEQMTALSYDLASFHNIGDDEAFEKVRSGLMGETEGLKSLGIVMNESTIQQAMLSMGYKGNESSLRKQFDAMDEATKAQVRLNVITSQSGDALTDVTRTSDSYTNSLKGVKGMVADFLSGAGAKFTPVLTKLFNTILDKWPTIEPMLMKFVDVLANGFADAVPTLLDLGMTLLPLLSDSLSIVFTVLQPLIPIISSFAQVVLPPLISIVSMFASTLLPPIMQILNVIVTSILPPIMPVLQVIAQSLLPPIAQLISLIAPILQALSPVLQYIGQVLGVIAQVVGEIIGWVANGVGEIIDWFSGIFGGAKDASAETDKLGDSMAAVADQVGTDIPAIEIPTVDVPTVDIPTVELNTTEAQTGMTEIGTTSDEMYQQITDQSTTAWDAMGTAATTGADGIILQFKRIREAADDIGTVTITTSVSGVGSDVPHNARGTDDHPGGWTHINDGAGGGELAYLPGGTAIVPADKTDQIIGRGAGTKVIHFAPNVNIDLHGGATEADKAEIDKRVRAVIRDEYEQLRAAEAEQEAIQEAIA